MALHETRVLPHAANQLPCRQSLELGTKHASPEQSMASKAQLKCSQHYYCSPYNHCNKSGITPITIVHKESGAKLWLGPPNSLPPDQRWQHISTYLEKRPTVPVGMSTYLEKRPTVRAPAPPQIQPPPKAIIQLFTKDLPVLKPKNSYVCSSMDMQSNVSAHYDSELDLDLDEESDLHEVQYIEVLDNTIDSTASFPAVEDESDMKSKSSDLAPAVQRLQANTVSGKKISVVSKGITNLPQTTKRATRMKFNIHETITEVDEGPPKVSIAVKVKKPSPQPHRKVSTHTTLPIKKMAKKTKTKPKRQKVSPSSPVDSCDSRSATPATPDEKDLEKKRQEYEEMMKAVQMKMREFKMRFGAPRTAEEEKILEIDGHDTQLLASLLSINHHDGINSPTPSDDKIH